MKNKMKKTLVIVSFAFFIIGSIGGSICSNILRSTYPSIVISIIEGVLVGVFSVLFYVFLVLSIGYVFEKEYLNKRNRIIIILLNFPLVSFMFYNIAMTISNDQGFQQGYVWMQIIVMLYCIIVIGKANQDGIAIVKGKDSQNEESD